MKNIVFCLLSLMILLAVMAAYQLSKFFSASTGAKIPKYQNPKAALLVMDMQKEFEHHQKILEPVNKAIELFASKKDAIIYIKTEYDRSDYILNFIRKNSAVKGSPAIEFSENLKMASGNIFSKNRMDAFSNSALDEFLLKNEIGRIYIAGLDGCYCVNKTTRAALNRGYDVTLIADAIAAKSDEKFAAAISELKALGAKAMTLSDIK